MVKLVSSNQIIKGAKPIRQQDYNMPARYTYDLSHLA